MIRREAPSDVLQSFVKAIHDSIIEPFRHNLMKLSFQRSLRESKRYQELEVKLKDYSNIYTRFKDDFYVRDNVLQALRSIHMNRMAQFIGGGKEVTVEESDDIRMALQPYMDLLKPVDDIRRLQTSLMTQAKLKKLPLPYDEITSTLTELSAVAASMPRTLMDGVSNLSEQIEKAA